jgi:hypothetical protein
LAATDQSPPPSSSIREVPHLIRPIKPGWRRTTSRRTKFGCGIGACDARTVQLNGKAERSCITAIGDIGDQEITTFKA